MQTPRTTYDVIIIGGGATGAGMARDGSRRGLRTLLLERSDIATGATGRNHGLLHSGARYAVTDMESAQECIRENNILKRIAAHCIENTGGLFISLPEDDLSYQLTFVTACHSAGIPADIIDPSEALYLEPSVNPDITGAVRVPDGAVDPFRLTLANIMDARQHGADILVYHEVTGLIKEGGRIAGVKVLDHHTKQSSEIYGEITVNAAGIWGQRISVMAGINIHMLPAKGSLLIFGHRINNTVINRCRKPSDADILVPGDTISLIGTTSGNIPYDGIDKLRVTQREADLLINEGKKLAPAVGYTRILRGYAGVRPLVTEKEDPTGRSASRGIVLLDHEIRDGISGYITITGGKLMTYRLMAEQATDLVCRKLKIDKKCSTADTELPGSVKESTTGKKIFQLPPLHKETLKSRYGNLANEVTDGVYGDNTIVCECEQVSRGEIIYALDHLEVNNLVDLRRRTRLGMGTCQGGLCACRAAAIMSEHKGESSDVCIDNLKGFLEERWKGVQPIAWGDALRESAYSEWIYRGLGGLQPTSPNKNQDHEI